MKKVLKYSFLVLLVMMIFITGCKKKSYCEKNGHDFSNATCTEASKCYECGAIKEEAKGHKWVEATCESPKTCSVCGEEEGNVTEHIYNNDCDIDCNLCGEERIITHNWKDATCENPKTCSVCGKIEGSVLAHTYDNDCDSSCNVCGQTRNVSHSYVAATCVKPATCSVCGDTTGDALGHTWVDATYTAPKTCTSCGLTEGNAIPEPKKIKVNKSTITVYLGKNYILDVTVEPINAPSEVVYSSNNTEVVTVDNQGVISGIKEGETYVVIRSKDFPNVKTRISVIVEKPPVDKIETNESLTLDYNEQYQLIWNVLPAQADQEVIFKSNDESIASVSESGLITGYKYGTTIIKICSKKDNTKFTEVTVNVTGDKATEIIVTGETIDLELGNMYKLDYHILPNTAYQGIKIVSENSDAIEVSNNCILGKKEGTYKIILSTIDDTNIHKTITVNIIADEEPIFVTDSIFISKTDLAWNEKFNPLDNIRAFDNKDGEITNNIIVTGEVDNRRYGEYTLEYYIEDSDGNNHTLIRNINVVWGYDVTVIGHAGSYYGVPNSEEAILYAAQVLKYPAIEIDLKQTKDGVFVLSHDPNWGDAILEETLYSDLKDVEYTVTKKAGVVENNLTEEQRTYTAKICTFERYLEICKEYNIIAVIELKTSAGISNWTEANTPNLSRMPKIMELIEKYNMLDRVIFLSSQELCLNWVKTNGYENIPCQYLTLTSCENQNIYNIVKKYNLDISFNVRDGIYISDEWLEKYRALGCKLAVFTFEEWAHYKDIQTWIDRGVDYVTTDWHELEKLNLPLNDND